MPPVSNPNSIWGVHSCMPSEPDGGLALSPGGRGSVANGGGGVGSCSVDGGDWALDPQTGGVYTYAAVLMKPGNGILQGRPLR